MEYLGGLNHFIPSCKIIPRDKNKQLLKKVYDQNTKPELVKASYAKCSNCCKLVVAKWYAKSFKI